MKYLFLAFFPCFFIQQLMLQNVELLSNTFGSIPKWHVVFLHIARSKVRLISPFQSPNRDLSQIVCAKTANGGNPDLCLFCTRTWNPSSQWWNRGFIFIQQTQRMALHKNQWFWYLVMCLAWMLIAGWSADISPFVNTDEDEFYRSSPPVEPVFYQGEIVRWSCILWQSIQPIGSGQFKWWSYIIFTNGTGSKDGLWKKHGFCDQLLPG